MPFIRHIKDDRGTGIIMCFAYLSSLVHHIFMSPLTLPLILTERVRSAPEALLQSDERRVVDEPKADDEKIHAQDDSPYCKTRSFLCRQQSP